MRRHPSVCGCEQHPLDNPKRALFCLRLTGQWLSNGIRGLTPSEAQQLHNELMDVLLFRPRVVARLQTHLTAHMGATAAMQEMEHEYGQLEDELVHDLLQRSVPERIAAVQEAVRIRRESSPYAQAPALHLEQLQVCRQVLSLEQLRDCSPGNAEIQHRIWAQVCA